MKAVVALIAYLVCSVLGGLVVGRRLRQPDPPPLPPVLKRRIEQVRRPHLTPTDREIQARLDRSQLETLDRRWRAEAAARRAHPSNPDR